MAPGRDPETEAFVDEARRVDIMTAFAKGGGSVSALRRQGREMVCPCPVHGGRRDKLNIHETDGVFFCRGEDGGGDAIALYQHLTGADFLDACEALTGRDRPRSDPSRSPEEAARRRREAEDRIAAQRVEADRQAARAAERENRFRLDEWARCVGDWNEAVPIPGTPAADYLAARNVAAPEAAYVRCHPALGYFHDRKRIHVGPAMLVLFVRPGASGWEPIGLHRTWVAPDNAPKFRPEIVDPASGEVLVSKKMRGSKAGGLLPLAGRYSTARRFVGGEGIETGLGWAAREGFRSDTFYFAAGDLGNLAGRAAKGSRVRDTTRRKIDRNGRRVAVFVPGDEPDLESPAVPIPDHCEELVLLGDGDSDPVFTRLAMKRAQRRHAREGRVIHVEIAPPGTDWAEIAAYEAAERAAAVA